MEYTAYVQRTHAWSDIIIIVVIHCTQMRLKIDSVDNYIILLKVVKVVSTHMNSIPNSSLTDDIMQLIQTVISYKIVLMLQHINACMLLSKVKNSVHLLKTNYSEKLDYVLNVVLTTTLKCTQ